MTHWGWGGGEKGGRKRGEGLPKSRILHGATAVSLCSPPLPTVCITRCSAVWWQRSPPGCSAGSPWPPEVRAPGSGQSGESLFSGLPTSSAQPATNSALTGTHLSCCRWGYKDGAQVAKVVCLQVLFMQNSTDMKENYLGNIQNGNNRVKSH